MPANKQTNKSSLYQLQRLSLIIENKYGFSTRIKKRMELLRIRLMRVIRWRVEHKFSTEKKGADTDSFFSSSRLNGFMERNNIERKKIETKKKQTANNS